MMIESQVTKVAAIEWHYEHYAINLPAVPLVFHSREWMVCHFSTHSK